MNNDYQNHSIFYLGGFTGLFEYYAKAFIYNRPSILILSILEHASMIIILWIIGGSSYLPIALIGGIVSLAISMGTEQFPLDFLGAKRSKFKDMFVSSPVHPMAFVMATILGVNIIYIIQAIIIFVLILLLDHITLFLVLQIILALFLLWIIGIALGYYLTARIVFTIDLMRIVRFFDLFLILLLPIYYQISLLPYPLEILALISPTTHVAILLRNFVGFSDGVPGIPLYFSWIYLCFCTILCIVVGVKSGRWQDI